MLSFILLEKYLGNDPQGFVSIKPASALLQAKHIYFLHFILLSFYFHMCLFNSH